MKTIGIIGGITWLSTIEYYRLLNQMIYERTGGAHTARIILYSVDFGELKNLTDADRWDEITSIICDAAKKLEQAGAACWLIAANTIHKIADEVQQAINIPLIHIAEVTANAVLEKQLNKVALLGTKYTMQMDFYKNKFGEKNITVIIPGEEDMNYIHASIYNELGKGIFLPTAKEKYVSIINELVQQGAEGAILGCTEIPFLVKQEDCPVPVFDTTWLHAKAAVEFAMR